MWLLLWWVGSVSWQIPSFPLWWFTKQQAAGCVIQEQQDVKEHRLQMEGE